MSILSWLRERLGGGAGVGFLRAFGMHTNNSHRTGNV